MSGLDAGWSLNKPDFNESLGKDTETACRYYSLAAMNIRKEDCHNLTCPLRFNLEV